MSLSGTSASAVLTLLALIVQKYKLVTQKALPGGVPRAACVQRLIPYSVYLVYWYESTNIDAIGAARGGAARRLCATADSNGKLSAIFCQLGQV